MPPPTTRVSAKSEVFNVKDSRKINLYDQIRSIHLQCSCPLEAKEIKAAEYFGGWRIPCSIL